MIVLDNVTENIIIGSVIVTSAVLTSTLFNLVNNIITTIYAAARTEPNKNPNL